MNGMGIIKTKHLRIWEIAATLKNSDSTRSIKEERARLLSSFTKPSNLSARVSLTRFTRRHTNNTSWKTAVKRVSKTRLGSRVARSLRLVGLEAQAEAAVARAAVLVVVVAVTITALTVVAIITMGSTVRTTTTDLTETTITSLVEAEIGTLKDAEIRNMTTREIIS